MPKYNYSRLNGKIIECFGTRKKFSEYMGISAHTMSLLLNGKTQWKQTDIAKACELLKISYYDIPEYFFTHIVQKN